MHTCDVFSDSSSVRVFRLRNYTGGLKRNVMLDFFFFPPNYNQQDAKLLDLFIATDAVHVSGGSSAHHQEHITVHTALSIVKVLSTNTAASC